MKTYFYILYVAKEIVNPGEDDVDEIFYVGRTTATLMKRLSQHLSDAKCSKIRNPKNNFIVEKILEGKHILCRQVFDVQTSDLLEISKIEDELIASYRRCGYRLFNERGGLSGSYKGTSCRIDWSATTLSLLGTDFDRNIANKLNCDTTTVTHKRIELGIPAFKLTKWKPEWDELLGTMSDREIAKQLNVGRAFVGKRRVELNIPATFKKH